MTDSEIVTALTACHKGNGEAECEKCPYVGKRGCMDILGEDALALINRQQAEIERLKKTQQTQADRLVEERSQKYEQIEVISKLKKQLKTAKSEAVREFAEKLKEHSCNLTEYDEGGWSDTVSAIKVKDIDRLLEKTGCNDG